jgi:hypothetical protein
VAVLTALGAGVTAWTLTYLRVPDFRLSAEAALGLFSVVGGAVTTSMLTFLRPDESVPADSDDPVVAVADTAGGNDDS